MKVVGEAKWRGSNGRTNEEDGGNGKEGRKEGRKEGQTGRACAERGKTTAAERSCSNSSSSRRGLESKLERRRRRHGGGRGGEERSGVETGDGRKKGRTKGGQMRAACPCPCPCPCCSILSSLPRSHISLSCSSFLQ